MTQHYLIPISYDAIRPLAGFPVQKGSYFLKRDALDPPEALLKKFFPEVDEWLRKFENNEVQSDMAGIGFLRMMQYLRRVIVQDSVVLMEKFPNLPLWSHPNFTCPEFLEFKAAANRLLPTIASPFDVRLRAVVPIIEQRLQDVQNTVTDTSNRAAIRLERHISETHTALRPIIREELDRFARNTRMDMLQSIIRHCQAEVNTMTHRGDGSPEAAAQPMEVVSIFIALSCSFFSFFVFVCFGKHIKKKKKPGY